MHQSLVEVENDENTSKRIPPVPIIGTIDFVNQTIYGNFKSEPISFEIWDKDGLGCIATSNDEAIFIEFLDSLNGEYQLRFYSDCHVYTGYIVLSE